MVGIYTKINDIVISDSSTRWNINHWYGMVSGVTNRASIYTLELSNILYKVNFRGFANATNLESLVMYYQGSEAITLEDYCFKGCISLNVIKLYVPITSTFNVGVDAFDGLPTTGTLYGYADWRSTLSLGSGWTFVQLD